MKQKEGITSAGTHNSVHLVSEEAVWYDEGSKIASEFVEQNLQILLKLKGAHQEEKMNNAQESSVKPTEIKVELERLDLAIKQLQGAFAQLTDRICPILSEQSADAKEIPPKKDSITPLGSTLSTCTYLLEALTQQVKDILNRVEL